MCSTARQTDEIEWSTAVGDADALIQAVTEHRPDAVLTDIRMPPTHTPKASTPQSGSADYPDIGVVVLSQFADDDYAFELLENGWAASGTSSRNASQIGTSWSGHCRRSPAGIRPGPKVIKCCSPARRTRNRLRCSDCPTASVRCSSRWRPGEQHTIAKTLYMSDRAVEKHIGSIFQKLGLVEEGQLNRRIMAVLAFLEATGPAR